MNTGSIQRVAPADGEDPVTVPCTQAEPTAHRVFSLMPPLDARVEDYGAREGCTRRALTGYRNPTRG